VPRIIAALRDQYAAVIGDRDDEGVVRAVLLWIITSSLETYEANQVLIGAQQELDAVRKAQNDKADKARLKARDDAKKVREVPSGPEEPNIPPAATDKPTKVAAKRTKR
jgi:hypothetical protein